MTVAELIEALEKIEDKTLDVVADIGLDGWEHPTEEVVEDIIETEAYYGKCENGGWFAKTRKCIKLID